MRALIESDLNTSEIVESINGVHESTNRWLEIPGIKNVLIRKLKKSETTNSKLYSQGSWAKLKTLSISSNRVRVIELINVAQGSDFKSDGGMHITVFVPQKSKIILHVDDPMVSKTFTTRTNRAMLIAIGASTSFSITNKSSSNLQLIVFYS